MDKADRVKCSRTYDRYAATKGGRAKISWLTAVDFREFVRRFSETGQPAFPPQKAKCGSSTSGDAPNAVPIQIIKERNMRYMLLIYTREEDLAKRSPEQLEQIKAGHWAVMDETRRLGILEAAEPLKPTMTATTVRHQDGKALVTDGPFAETKEQLAGYYILDCKDLDEAISWAARIPTSCGGMQGCVEIRPIQGLPSRNEAEVAQEPISSTGK
jgi:hypothetical protein